MKDRVPTPGQEGRVKITPESGGATYYAKIEMADNPTQLGDEPIKANLLPDAVATALGLTGNPQVKDALTALQSLANGKAQIATGSYAGSGTYGSSNPNSLQFSGEPKTLEIWSIFSWGPEYFGGDSRSVSKILLAALPNDNTYHQVSVPSAGSGDNRTLYVKKTADGKTVSWYSTESNTYQCNDSSGIYTFLVHI